MDAAGLRQHKKAVLTQLSIQTSNADRVMGEGQTDQSEYAVEQ